MLKNEVVIKVLGKASLAMPEINQLQLRDILEEVLYTYEVTSKTKELAVINDIQDKIILFLASKKIDGLSDKSLYNYKLQLARFSSYMQKDIDKIETMDIRMFLGYLSKQNNLKQTSLSTTISILKSFFNWLEQEEYILKSPMRKIKQPKKQKNLRKALTIEELEVLRNACKTLRERALLEFIFSTGCRLSEISNIKIKDINWSNYSLKVIGKGSKEREVFFSAKAKIHLDSYLQSRKDKSEWLFVSNKGEHTRLGNRSIQREVKNIAKRAKFSKSIYPHLLRHTMATLALSSGASLTSIQMLLGHEDLATTQVYAKLDKSSVREEYRKYLNQ